MDNDLGIGYIISDIAKDNYKVLDLKEKLPTIDIVLAFNKKFLTNAPKRFIEDYINLEIK